MNERTTILPHGPHTVYALAFFLILFSPHLHVYIKTRAHQGISSPPLSFAIRQGSFPADVAKSVLIRFSPPPAGYRSGRSQRPLRACLHSYFYMYLYNIYDMCTIYTCKCAYVKCKVFSYVIISYLYIGKMIILMRKLSYNILNKWKNGIAIMVIIQYLKHYKL